MTEGNGGTTISLGVAGRSESDTQPQAYHGATLGLSPAAQYQVTFTFDLASWDSYNEDTGTGTGYWDSFSISLTDQPYPHLALTDPVSFPFVWGGGVWGDGVLDTSTGTLTLTLPGNLNGNNYLNVVLDTATPPTQDDLYPSWGTVTITSELSCANHPPVIDLPQGGWTVDETETLTFTVTVTDPDPGDQLTYGLVGAPPGAFIDPETGVFSWTPSENQGPGTYEFGVIVIDDGSPPLWDEETIIITINEVNNPPVANDNAYALLRDQTLTVDASWGVLGNDFDSDNDPLTASLVSSPSHGTLTLNSDGSFDYTPNAGFEGTDTFTYNANDGVYDSNIATVTIDIITYPPPVAVDDFYTVARSGSITISADRGILVNDFDLDGDPLTAVLVSGPSYGQLSLSSDGSFTYTNTSSTNVLDTFTYRAADPSNNLSQPATVTIAVGQTVTIEATQPTATLDPPRDGEFTVTRFGNLDSPLTVYYTINPSSTAVPGQDYAPLSGSVEIPAYFEDATIYIHPLDTAQLGSGKTVMVDLQLNSSYALGSPSSAMVTIEKPLPLVTVQATEPVTDENNASSPGVFTITRTGSTDASLSVLFTISGTASNGVDYQALSLSTNIPAGASSVDIQVVPIDDSIEEGDETVVLGLDPSSNYQILTHNTSAEVTIRDNEQAPEPTIKVVGDTNRDGRVNAADEANREKWTKTSGAIFTVNHDDNNGDRRPDAIDFNNNGVPFNEDKRIDTGGDVQDIAPLVIRATGPLPADSKVFLRLESVEDAQSVHIFKAIAAGETAILGDIGARVAGGAQAPTEVEITSFLNPNQDTTFGLEGMFYRYTGNFVPLELHFDGFIDIFLELRDNAGKVLKSDRVRFKVAPWIMLSNRQASQEVWASDMGVLNERFRLRARAEPGYTGLDNSHQLRTVAYDGPNRSHWFQDHAEIGYTHRPGGPKVYATFRLPYDHPDAPQPPWVKDRLLGPGFGVFQLGRSLIVPQFREQAVGNFGGNLEVMPPTATHPLGQIVVGDRMSVKMLAFLRSQQVQPVFTVPTSWLRNGHVDEVFGFDRVANRVIVADPQEAYNLLNAIPAADRGKSMFFALGNTLSGTVPAAATENPTIRIMTGIDLSGATERDWKYIRIYAGGEAKGQIARINRWGNGWVEVDKVWDTSTNITTDEARSSKNHWHWSWSRIAVAPNQGTWIHQPQAGDKFVLLQDSQFWWGGTPAAVTVEEVLADANFRTANLDRAQELINEIKNTLDDKAGGRGTLTFIKVPVLYFAWPGPAADFRRDKRAYAFAPGLANFQILGKDYYFPRQFGPRDAAGRDIFEKATKDQIASALFVDTWGEYHTKYGDLHCGTLVRREKLDLDWWSNQP
ncbi:MAG TPA: protein-arginine deiminase family protein [Gemmataceae bacterium]|nr:protein-arginine deiminase family protein [Gemmataceae bacterium]